MKARRILFSLILALVFSLSACTKPVLPEPKEAFSHISQYQGWADDEGYGHGALEDEGMSGMMQDTYRTKPGMAGYDSGRIVIGDSRCCQLGIYQERAGIAGFAAFAVWGGHYAEKQPYIPTADFWSEVFACFREQAKARGKCEIFFFATVNDYDADGYNDDNIAAAIACAEKLAMMECEQNGVTIRPTVIVIGPEGCGSGERAWLDPTVFNRSIASYNDSLREAVAKSFVLKGGLDRFTTVPELTGGRTDFIDDGLHYGDKTLGILAGFICSFK